MSTSIRQLDDSELLSRVAKRERDAVEALYDRHSTLVYSVARSIVVDGHYAEEVVQDVFLTVWKQADRFDERRGQVVSWLASLARNKAIDRVRRESVRFKAADPGQEAAAEERAGSEDATPETVWQTLLGERVRVAMAELSPQQREVIDLAWFQGYSQSELAERLGQPLGTIKTRLFYGMRRLRELLDAEGLVDA